MITSTNSQIPIPFSNVDDVACLIDHALLLPTYTDRELRVEIAKLHEYSITSVCIKPYAVALCKEELAGTPIDVCTVIGFPHGSPRGEAKALETELAMQDGATEIDMVANIGKAISGDWDYVRQDINRVLEVVRARGGKLKVIFETGILPDDETKIGLCRVCSELGVDFVKTSTGFGYVKTADGHSVSTGATDHDLKLMREYCAPNVGVKASGGMRSFEDVQRAVGLGVTRIGTTSTQVILDGARQFFAGEGKGSVAQTDY